MKTQEGEITYPVPWASDSSICNLASIEEYKEALKGSGFELVGELVRRDFALDFFKNVKIKNEARGGPDPLGLHTLMQTSAPIKIQNMIKNISIDLIAPIELIARKL